MNNINLIQSISSLIDKKFNQFKNDIDQRFDKSDKKFNQFKKDINQRFDKSDEYIHQLPDFIRDLVKIELEEVINRKLDEKLDEKLGAYPTKDKFTTQMSEVMGELQDIRDEFAINGQQVRDNQENIEKLQKLHSPSHPHFATN